MIDLAGFRAAFPAFANTTTFPDATITFWLDQVPNAINLDLLGTSADLATCYFVAHNIVLAAQDAQNATVGSFGKVSGPITSSSVGGVSKSTDVASSSYSGAGYYNATSYGRQLYQLLRRFSLGGVTVSPPRVPLDASLLYGSGVFSPFGR